MVAFGQRSMVLLSSLDSTFCIHVFHTSLLRGITFLNVGAHVNFCFEYTILVFFESFS